ncbi:hypothetical protein [Nocardia sp. NPDC051832]|uniref:hypothetical protein n=1 Tax=Nocardia sp. NPDC051832 TaxID=3155673 RepID=UPI00341A929C
MNSSTSTRSFSALSVVAGAAMSASRGISALQGIGLSGVSAFGTKVDVTAKAVSFTHPICVQRQADKPNGAWHLAAQAAPGAFVIDSGYEPVGHNPAAAGPAADIAAGIDMANRLRTAEDPATVIRDRHRCRIR